MNTITIKSKDKNAFRIIVPSYKNIDIANNNEKVTEIKMVELEVRTPARYNTNAAAEYPQTYIRLYS